MSKNKTGKKSKGIYFRIQDIETTVKYVESRLIDNWCIVSFGGSQLMSWFKTYMYPEDTHENVNIETIDAASPFCICRKTNELREFCENHPAFETILEIKITDADDRTVKIDTASYSDGHKKESIDSYMLAIRNILNCVDVE